MKDKDSVITVGGYALPDNTKITVEAVPARKVRQEKILLTLTPKKVRLPLKKTPKRAGEGQGIGRHGADSRANVRGILIGK